MNLIVNSEKHEFRGHFIADLMKELGLVFSGGMALAVNDQVIPGSQWSEYRLNENDKILIIRASQGG